MLLLSLLAHLTNFCSQMCLLSLWLIGTVHAEAETVISRAWVQSPDPAD